MGIRETPDSVSSISVDEDSVSSISNANAQRYAIIMHSPNTVSKSLHNSIHRTDGSVY